jgi:hypothetical protein
MSSLDAIMMLTASAADFDQGQIPVVFEIPSA